jgi:hypothetical protein
MADSNNKLCRGATASGWMPFFFIHHKKIGTYRRLCKSSSRMKIQGKINGF